MKDNPYKLAEVGLKYHPKKNLAEQPKISCPEEAVDYARTIWDNDSFELAEDFVVLMLSPSKNALGWSRISRGSSTSTVVEPVSVFRLAMLSAAHSILCFHQHGSGNKKPSAADIHLTKRLSEIGKLLNIHLEDHIILTRTDYTSLREMGYI